MIVSIGQFQLQKRKLLPDFLKLSKQIHQEALCSNGNITAELNNEGIAFFYAFTHWDNLESMLAFVHSGTHQKALSQMETLCKQASFLYFESSKSVLFSDAKKELETNKNTRILKF